MMIFIRDSSLSLFYFRNFILKIETIMSNANLRQEVHAILDSSDDRIIKLIYGLLKADQEDESILTDEHKQIIDERLKDYELNPQDVLTWDEVKANIKKL